jgi:predicted DsbA family dithiol-disulfide isomerase
MSPEKHRPSLGITLEVWSDVVCPWCYIGKRRLEEAFENFEHRDDVQVVWRSFELDPAAPKHSPLTGRERLAAKYGVSLQEADAMQARVTGFAAGEGLSYRLDLARPANTFDAHRLLHFAKARERQGDLQERLMKAHFMEGAALGDPETLVSLAAEAGFDADAVRAVVLGDAHAEDVRADEERALQLGIRGVPFFLAAGRYGASGAQPAAVLLDLLRKAWDAR